MDIIIGAVIGFTLLVALVVITPTVKIAMDIAPFLYTNTRCSARSGAILDRKRYDSMLATTYTKELYAELEETPYAHVAERANRFGNASFLLDKDLFETYSWLESVMPEKIRPILTAMKGKFEIQELKDAMNAVADGHNVGELHAVRDATLQMKIEEAVDMGALAAALSGTPYEHLVRGETVSATELDKHYLETVLDVIDACKDRKAAEPFRDYWRRIIDFANIRLALRRIREGTQEGVAIRGGLLPPEKLLDASDVNQLEEILRGTQYEEISLQEGGVRLERSFLKEILEEAARISAKHPLKGGPIVHFIAKKENEVRNLNIILKLKTEGFEADEINDLLV